MKHPVRFQANILKRALGDDFERVVKAYERAVKPNHWSDAQMHNYIPEQVAMDVFLQLALPTGDGLDTKTAMKRLGVKTPQSLWRIMAMTGAYYYRTYNGHE